MDAAVAAQIGVLLVVALVWLVLNLHAGATWLKFISLWAMLGFLAAASFIAVDAVFGFGVL